MIKQNIFGMIHNYTVKYNSWNKSLSSQFRAVNAIKFMLFNICKYLLSYWHQLSWLAAFRNTYSNINRKKIVFLKSELSEFHMKKASKYSLNITTHYSKVI